jgi:hypothetical protein
MEIARRLGHDHLPQFLVLWCDTQVCGQLALASAVALTSAVALA